MGVLTSLAVGIAAVLGLGIISQYFQAGAGLAQLGVGLQEIISRPLSPQITPYFEIGIGENVRGLIDFFKGLFSGTQPSGAFPWFYVEQPVTPTPIAPYVPSGPRDLTQLYHEFLAGFQDQFAHFPAFLEAKYPIYQSASPRRMYGIDGSKL